MKAILEYDLYEDKTEFLVASKALDVSIFIHEFKEKSLRRRLKYDDNITTEQYEIIGKINDEFIELLSDHGLLDLLD